jgi:hypothetical protein
LTFCRINQTRKHSWNFSRYGRSYSTHRRELIMKSITSSKEHNNQGHFFHSLLFLFATISSCNLQASTFTGPSDWTGLWACNLDGRKALLSLGRMDLYQDLGGGISSLCSDCTIGGEISDNGGPWRQVEKRSLTANDPPASVTDHLLPLLYNGEDHWLLVIHTWDRDYASGYTTWSGRPYGLQCQKTGRQSCGPYTVLDCSGNCVEHWTAEFWIGDGYCDDGRYGIDLMCEAFSYDRGDCAP